MLAAFARFSVSQMIEHLRADPEPCFFGLFSHPDERIFGKSAVNFRIASSDIGVDACKPHLLDVLSLCHALVEGVGFKFLWFIPFGNAEHAPTLINGQRMAKARYRGVLMRVWQFFQARYPEA